MGFVWVHADSFLHSVASPFHSFVFSTELEVQHMHGAHSQTCDFAVCLQVTTELYATN